MKTLLFIFTICTTLTFGQTSAEKIIIGEWSSCGWSEVSLASDLVLKKKTFVEFASDCTKNNCAYISISFESIQGVGSAVVKKYKGCKNDLAVDKVELIGWTWSVSKDGKTLFVISDDKKHYSFAIEGSTPTSLSLRRI